MAFPRLLAPLRIRDYAVLWTAMTVSHLGDGIFLVASAWQVYQLSNDPAALAFVWLVWSLPLLALLLLGGVISDRADRRSVMIVADLIRGAAMAALAALAFAGALELWHVLVLVAFYGVGDEEKFSYDLARQPSRSPATTACSARRRRAHLAVSA